jgi:hypothetical protein
MKPVNVFGEGEAGVFGAEGMKNLSEVRDAMVDQINLCPDNRVVIHVGNATDDRDHIDSLNCWCKPMVMTGQEFMDAQFDQ